MRSNHSILVVVPARGGSKGVKLKNIRKLDGVPLVARVGDLVSRLGWVDRSVVSTDHEEIAAVALSSGLACPFRRPEEISGDQIGDVDVLLHALFATEEHDDREYDIIVMLQPTSPMRSAEDVETVVDLLISGGYDSVWSVSETDSKGHPLKQLTLCNQKVQFYESDGAKIIARQQLNPVYHRNGVAYAVRREFLVNEKSLLSDNTGAYVVDRFQISIDTELDLELASYFLNKV